MLVLIVYVSESFVCCNTMPLLHLSLFLGAVLGLRTGGHALWLPPTPLGLPLELAGQVLDELSEEVGAAVLAELVEHEPVAKMTLAQDVLETFVDAGVMTVPHLDTMIIMEQHENSILTPL